MPGEEGMLAALMEAVAGEGKMPGEGKGMPGALAEAPAPAPAEKHRVFTKTSEAVSIAALPALGSYTRRGSTANFDVYYDNSLGANGLTLADAVLANCEYDFARLRGWFGGVAAGRFSVYIDPGSFGAYHANCAATEIHCAAFGGTDGALENMLNVAEVDEVMMNNQGAGWACGSSNGEGLSRVLATQRYPASLDGFASAASWLNSARPDSVSTPEATDRDYVSTGCATLFINYLRYQLHFSLARIVQADPPYSRPIKTLPAPPMRSARFRPCCSGTFLPVHPSLWWDRQRIPPSRPRRLGWLGVARRGHRFPAGSRLLGN